MVIDHWPTQRLKQTLCNVLKRIIWQEASLQQYCPSSQVADYAPVVVNCPSRSSSYMIHLSCIVSASFQQRDGYSNVLAPVVAIARLSYFLPHDVWHDVASVGELTPSIGKYMAWHWSREKNNFVFSCFPLLQMLTGTKHVLITTLKKQEVKNYWN